ncbi:hypothetical protein [Mongoliibacter sp.]|uniref:hypothetical protein n=1 Tax=Mongoliibacter sp. TaxID=2022438 RepID=UPI0025EF52E5|nr:hypothetical protein [Mongoliibacter sp.]
MSIIDRLYKAFTAGDIPTVLDSKDSKIAWNEAEGKLGLVEFDEPKKQTFWCLIWSPFVNIEK